MKWDHRKYYSGDFQFKKEFGKKAIKLSLDGGFTCPHREKGKRGCIFCSEKGSGEFAGSGSDAYTPIHIQIRSQLELLEKKWGSKNEDEVIYIGYFQSFTGTFAPVEYLRKVYYEALSHPMIGGIAIATRPDSIDEDCYGLLEEISKTHILWLELGVQTFNPQSSKLLNLGYDENDVIITTNRLRSMSIPFVLHFILGLPGENWSDYNAAIGKINSIQPWGIKIHMLNILKDTELERLYRESPFHIMEPEEYIATICNMLERLSPDIGIHRLTGDGAKDMLIAPLWIKDKRKVLNGIDKELKRRNSRQGEFFNARD